MKLHITIDESNNTPIYKQIAGSIMKDIASGKLPAGYQLPTVRQLAEEMDISKGTIKHAYESLKHMGAIEMIQGRGCFVLGREADTSSRKEQAMAAIDTMLEELESLGFTPKEIEIYLKLKLTGLDEKYDLVKVAVVDCNPETINLIEKQLEKIEFIQVASFDLGNIAAVAQKLNEEYDLVITTTTHFPEVEAENVYLYYYPLYDISGHLDCGYDGLIIENASSSPKNVYVIKQRSAELSSANLTSGESMYMMNVHADSGAVNLYHNINENFTSGGAPGIILSGGAAVDAGSPWEQPVATPSPLLYNVEIDIYRAGDSTSIHKLIGTVNAQ